MRIFEATNIGLMRLLPVVLIIGGAAMTILSMPALALDGPTQSNSDQQIVTLQEGQDAASNGTVPASKSDSATSESEDAVSSAAATSSASGPSAADLAKVPFDALGSVVDATRNAIRSYLAGNKRDAIKSLEFAADQGHAPAQWKLARMYAEGDGVPRDDIRAFDTFSRVCDRHADEAPDSPTAPFVSNSFVALGSYYLTGIPNSAVKANPARAREMFTYSASYFGDPQAQLILARLYLDGIGGAKDMKQAVRWLNLSAEKGNRIAQAQLGQILFSGDAGFKQRARGLMWLSVARAGADPEKDAWIIDAHEDAMEKSTDADRLAATAYVTQRERRHK